MLDWTGQRIGNYQILRSLGRGGFANVYLGQHIYLKTYAAIKVLQTQLAQQDLSTFLLSDNNNQTDKTIGVSAMGVSCQ